MSWRILLFAEDELGAALARDLCDRVVIERGPTWLSDIWKDTKLREQQRQWTGLEQGTRRTSWAASKKLAPHISARDEKGRKRSGYELLGYRAARLAEEMRPAPDIIVLCHDSDGNKNIREDMLRGVQGLTTRINGDLQSPYIFAFAHQEAEAWVMAGFTPKNRIERNQFRALVKEYGFDPTSEPHRLTAKRKSNPYDSKRACEALLPEGTLSPRSQACWLDTKLDRLEERGRETGICEYLADVTTKLLPLLGAQQPHASQSAD